MTVVVGLVDGDRVVMGCDSCITHNGLAHTHNGPKWRIVGDDAAVAYSGNVMVWQILETCLKPFNRRKSMSAESRITQSVVDPLRKAMTKAGEDPDDDPPDLLVVLPRGMGDRLWRVHAWVVIPSEEGVATIGSGGSVAHGAIEHATGTPEERVLKSLKSASRVLGVRPPYHVVSF
jgi:20S proteasome alpha/beta subunit